MTRTSVQSSGGGRDEQAAEYAVLALILNSATPPSMLTAASGRGRSGRYAPIDDPKPLGRPARQAMSTSDFADGALAPTAGLLAPDVTAQAGGLGPDRQSGSRQRTGPKRTTRASKPG